MKNPAGDISANQYPERKNLLTRFIRTIASSCMPCRNVSDIPARPQGISIYMRVKDERDWIETSIASIRGVADEIIVVDNGSTDGTHEILQALAHDAQGLIKLWSRPELQHCDLSNFAMAQTSFRWVFRWDGDMVAHTEGKYAIDGLRSRILALNPRRCYVIYLRHINLAGDLFHQNPKEMVHIEEYMHTFSTSARFVHPGRYEAVKFPLYYKPLFWYEPYVFHVNIKPAHRMLLRYFWEDWMELKDYKRYPTLEDYVRVHIAEAFGTASLEEAQRRCVKQSLHDHIPFDTGLFGPYPALLQPFAQAPRYRIRYENGMIAGREER